MINKTALTAAPAPSVTTNFLPYLGMGTDAADGRIRLQEGVIDIQWSHRRSRKLFQDMEQLMKELSRSLHGQFVTSLLWRWPIRKLLTAIRWAAVSWAEPQP